MPSSRGHLTPGTDGVLFERFELGFELRTLVRHVWVVRWSIPEGEVSQQRVLTYPAFNAVLTPGGASLHGPDPRCDVRELTGSAWAVGILFRPAAGPLLTGTPTTALVASGERLTCPVLEQVRDVMNSAWPFASTLRSAQEADRLTETDRSDVVRLLHNWLTPLAAHVDDAGLLVNRASHLAETNTAILRAADLADELNMSLRSLERVVKRFTGLSPKWLIECRRIQHAATTLFTEPETDLTGLAAELGFADYPHFARRYKSVLAETPDQTRAAGLATRSGRSGVSGAS